MRRPRVEWMTRTDDAILEFLLNEGNRPLNASPRMIESNIEFAISTIRGRLAKLLEAGLVEYYDEGRGIYRISQKGRAYLAGELDAEDLEFREE
ncbi:ArsR family transcriptional regulator [Haloprofundus sp. MHR1]|uniref:ArsR family transcriptional regulator n=1 Tax=Haloprofundus sp. MHR1 TaxID=2572921 RepID=UPI0010BE28A4|nr:ArsR family transcriptional regulator [Haloprofundus sp. MHR1]QCJ47221.1 ArsR family transcriptional regulator [Haloprofundus sp. MHR1]